MKYIELYRWSSYLNYIGKKNFPSVTQREFLSEVFGGPENYRKNVSNWLKEMDSKRMKEMILE